MTLICSLIITRWFRLKRCIIEVLECLDHITCLLLLKIKDLLIYLLMQFFHLTIKFTKFLTFFTISEDLIFALIRNHYILFVWIILLFIWCIKKEFACLHQFFLAAKFWIFQVLWVQKWRLLKNVLIWSINITIYVKALSHLKNEACFWFRF